MKARPDAFDLHRGIDPRRRQRDDIIAAVVVWIILAIVAMPFITVACATLVR